MDRKKLKELMYLLDEYVPDCEETCDKCAFGVHNINEDDEIINCPISEAIDLIHNELYNPIGKELYNLDLIDC